VSCGALVRNAVPHEGEEVGDLLAMAEEAIVRGARDQALLALHRLEAHLAERLRALRDEAVAVADANVNAVELMFRQEALAEELREQNLRLREQNSRIEAAARDLETQSRATADANVDAVLLSEQAQAETCSLRERQARLGALADQLATKIRALEQEAAALTAANAAAATTVVEKERAIGALAEQARRTEAERIALEAKVFVDELTGLFNHRYFREQLRLEVARARKYGRALSLAFFDIDHFKRYNDSHGHLAGDHVLKGVAERIRSRTRDCDVAVRSGPTAVAVCGDAAACSGPTAVAARYGGEEFVVILPETGLSGAIVTADRIRRIIEEAQFVAPNGVALGGVTVSAGVATLEPGDPDGNAVVARADKALYRAKAAGRNRVDPTP
jgi:GGDEF domain-containing protein